MSTQMSTDMHQTRSSVRTHAPPGGHSSDIFGTGQVQGAPVAGFARAGEEAPPPQQQQQQEQVPVVTRAPAVADPEPVRQHQRAPDTFVPREQAAPQTQDNNPNVQTSVKVAAPPGGFSSISFG